METCPNCGSQFKAGRLACPECGSDASTGWREASEIDYLSVDIPDSYEEWGGAATQRPPRWPRVVAVVVIVAMVTGYLVGWF